MAAPITNWVHEKGVVTEKDRIASVRKKTPEARFDGYKKSEILPDFFAALPDKDVLVFDVNDCASEGITPDYFGSDANDGLETFVLIMPNNNTNDNLLVNEIKRLIESGKVCSVMPSYDGRCMYFDKLTVCFKQSGSEYSGADFSYLNARIFTYSSSDQSAFVELSDKSPANLMKARFDLEADPRVSRVYYNSINDFSNII